MQGMRIDRLTVDSFAGKNKHGAALWNCTCSCGNKVTTVGFYIRQGKVKSCGCLNRDNASAMNKSHGLCMSNGDKTDTYKAWAGMNSRCNNPDTPIYARYGGVGIKVCDRWKDFSLFINDMGDKPAGKSLDRIDHKKGYSPDNCRWATNSEQAQNRRTPAHNTSGVKNVTWRRGGWRVKVTVNGKRTDIGPFEDIELAELVAFELRRKLHGEFSCNV